MRSAADEGAPEVPPDVSEAVKAENRYAQLLLRLAEHPLAVRLEKTRIELRAELGRSPSARETWFEFQARHPAAARSLLASVVHEPAGERPA